MDVLPRIIPSLLLSDRRFVKTTRFRRPRYVGDPLNVLRIFNDKEVDEVIILDIEATPHRRRPNFDYVRDIVSECFMPVTYGGGIRNIEDAQRLVAAGVEKLCINTRAAEDLGFVERLADLLGSQSVTVSVDAHRSRLGGWRLYTHGGRRRVRRRLEDYLLDLQRCGCGEILINSVDRDGVGSGLDIKLIQLVSSTVQMPVIACGGAAALIDFRQAIETGGASALAAGSMFVFHGPHRAVLVTYPDRRSLLELFDVTDASLAGV